MYKLAYVKLSLKKSVCDNNLSQSSNVNASHRSTNATGQNNYSAFTHQITNLILHMSTINTAG